MYIRKIKNKVVYNDNLLSIKVDRGNIKFLPGQHFSISIKGKFINREYSAFSSDNNDEIKLSLRDSIARCIIVGNICNKITKESFSMGS